MGVGDYVLGTVILAATWGCAQGAAWIVVGRLTPRLAGAPRALAFGVLATAGVVAAYLLPGMFGVLSRWSGMLTAVLLLGAVWRFAPRTAGAPVDDSPPA